MRGGPPGPQNLSENDQLRQQLQELLKQKKMLESNVRMAEGRKDRRHTTGRPFWGVADRRKYMQMRNAILSRLQPLLHHRLRQERRMLQTRKQMRRIGKHLKPIKKDKKKGKKKKGGKRRGDDDEEMTKKEIEDEYRQANDERRRPSRFDKYEDDEY